MAKFCKAGERVDSAAEDKEVSCNAWETTAGSAMVEWGQQQNT